MASSLDVKLVVKHIANGSFGENLCRVCLAPLTEFCENVFTNICKEGKEYCIADVLKEICDIKITNDDHYNVCPDCFTAASIAYKFYLNAKANEEVLQYYTDELEKHLKSVHVPEDIKAESICISLPEVPIDYFDYEIKDIRKTKYPLQECKKGAKNVVTKDKSGVIKTNNKAVEKEEQESDEIVIVMNEKGLPTFFKLLPDGSLVSQEFDERCKKALETIPKKEDIGKKVRRKREPMTSKACPRCPIRYRFIAKLKEHMITEHGAELFSCKICEAVTEDIEEYYFHSKTHTNIYECDICKVTFKKRETIIDHLKEHKDIGNGYYLISDFVCESCGMIFMDNESLKSHTDLNHYKKYACYYCGRTYKSVISFEKHVKKHEVHLKQDEKLKQLQKQSLSTAEARQLIALKDGGGGGGAAQAQWTCEQCGRGFRSERSLLWHARLHNNERPFVCDVCGRGFVSLNRRNQHRLCAHSAPSRRCPLCPALFHMRSMVNTHIKKVHLKKHKRRTRAVRHAAVSWRTEPVPVQELSVALQGDILELQAKREAEAEFMAEEALYNEE